MNIQEKKGTYKYNKVEFEKSFKEAFNQDDKEEFKKCMKTLSKR